VSNKSVKSIFDERHGKLIAKLVELRKSKGLTQRDLVAKSGYDKCFVGRVETREHRLDLIELIDYMRALDLSDSEILELIRTVVEEKNA